MQLQKFWTLGKATIDAWTEDKAASQGAALAFYSILSIGPLLLLVLAAASAIFGAEAAQGRIVQQMTNLVGTDGAKAIEDIIKASTHDRNGLWATILSVVTLLFSASGVFGEMQSALNTIWHAEPKPNRGLWGLVQDRFLSFTMVFGTCFLLLVSMVLSAVLSAVANYAAAQSNGFSGILQVADLVISLAIVTLLFALLYKYVPDIKIAWRDVWVGAAITALLFIIGKFLIGWYLGYSNMASSYGAAGSVIILMVWVYYSAQILLLGAAFTHAYAQSYGSHNSEPH